MRKKTSFLAEFLLEKGTWLEGVDLAGGYDERFAGLGIAPYPIVLLVDDELAEAGKLDFLTSSKSLLDDIQNGLHYLFRFFSREITVL